MGYVSWLVALLPALLLSYRVQKSMCWLILGVRFQGPVVIRIMKPGVAVVLARGFTNIG